MTARWNQRGVAYWTDGSAERVFWGTSNGFLLCVDAATGRPCADFGENGRVDLTRDIPRAGRGDRDWLNALLYSVQSPPLVVGDTIITPSSISSYNITREAPPGWMRGFDVHSGRTKWTFHTIPQGDEFGNDTWGGDSWRVTGKVGVWTMMSADPELGLVYLPTNTPAPDYYGGHRPGENLFAESVVALDIETGQREWHFQAVHHGLWDYDFPAAPNLVDIEVDGRPIKALAQVSKQGFLYVFDRVTGEPVWPIEERPVDTETDVPGEVPYPTQPFPTKPPPFAAQGVSLDDANDLTPEIHRLATEELQTYRLGPLFTPPSLQGTLQRPRVDGGANWGGAALDPTTNRLYVRTSEGVSANQVCETDPELPEVDVAYTNNCPRGGSAGIFRGLGGYVPAERSRLGPIPLVKPPYARLVSIDLNAGDIAWSVPFGEGSRIMRAHPLLRGVDLPDRLGTPGAPGPMVTGGGLVFLGGGDPYLYAFDAETGREVTRVATEFRTSGNPMTYRSRAGRQFILIATGAGPDARLVAFALPEG